MHDLELVLIRAEVRAFAGDHRFGGVREQPGDVGGIGPARRAAGGGEAAMADHREVPSSAAIGERSLELRDRGQRTQPLSPIEGEDQIRGDVPEERRTAVASGVGRRGDVVDEPRDEFRSSGAQLLGYFPEIARVEIEGVFGRLGGIAGAEWPDRIPTAGHARHLRPALLRRRVEVPPLARFLALPVVRRAGGREHPGLAHFGLHAMGALGDVDGLGQHHHFDHAAARIGAREVLQKAAAQVHRRSYI